MNIFVLDRDPIKAAQYHNDKHCVKMVLEYAQLLSSAHHMLDSDVRDDCYRLTHKNHRCAVWTRESSANYIWLLKLFHALSEEFTIRYNKVHKTFKERYPVLSILPRGFSEDVMTPFALAMPDHCKHSDPVIAYRNLYIMEKQHIANWKTEIPYWYEFI